MTFNRVIYRPDGSRQQEAGLPSPYSRHYYRRLLRAWDTAVRVWRHLQASERGDLPYTVEPTGAALAARSWEFLAGPLVTSPSAVAKGF